MSRVFSVPGHRLALAGTVTLTLFITGCATPAPTSGSAIDRANANFTTTVATGAVAGAALGAIGGALLGGHNRGTGAAVGALAGGALGTGVGYMVASNNSAQAKTEDTLGAQIQASQKRAADANAAATEAHQAAVQAEAQSRALLSQYQAGKISAAEYRRQLSNSIATEQSIQKLLGNLQNEESGLRTQIAAAGPNAEQLKRSYDNIEASRSSLQDSYNELTNATSAVPQG